MTNKKALDILFSGPVGYTLNEYNEASNVIYKSLERLEALEYALKLKQDAIDSLNVANELLSNRINVLNQENEKLKKALEIIKKLYLISLNYDEDYEECSIEINGYKELHKQEYELLKEVLGE